MAGESACPVAQLPDELVVQIFQRLPLDALLAAGAACARWRRLARDAAAWRGRELLYSGKPGQAALSERNLRILSARREVVRRLRVQYVYNWPLLASILRRLPRLTSLELVMCRVAADFPAAARRWPRLRRLSLKNSLLLLHREDAPEVLVPFDRLPQLTHVTLADFGLSPRNVGALASLRHLTHLHADKIKSLGADDVRLLAGGGRLRSLHLYGGEAIDDDVVILLTASGSLRELALVRCERLTDRCLPALGSLPLVSLQLWNNAAWSEAALVALLAAAALARLRSLSLSRVAAAGPAAAEVIAHAHPELRFLALYQCQRIIGTDYEKQLKAKFRNIDVVLY